MELYWKDMRLVPGTLLRIEERGNDIFDETGVPVEIRWRILEIRARGEGEDYLDPYTGKSFSLRKVLKRRKLQRKREQGELVDVPASSDYLLLRVYHNGASVGYRCFSIDMLGILYRVEIVEE